MAEAAPSPAVVRFGAFEVDLRAGELRKQGLKVRLQERPFQILSFLLENPGDVVTREELRKHLWPEDTFVDFDHSVNTAINKLRDALGDSAENPRFIETLPRHGYRFIVSVDYGAAGQDRRIGRVRGERSEGRRWLAAVAIFVVAVILLFETLVALNIASLRDWLLGSTAQPKIESIAVLPFENLSGDPEQEYFADGMTEELITDLGKISALRVISRTSVMRYKGTKKTVPEIGRELNVDAIVEGTARRSGDRMHITVNLLYAPTDRHLWARTYDSSLGDVLSLQDRVARSIADEIEVKVQPNEQVRFAHARAVNPAAYDHYLKARYHYFKWRPDEFRQAIDEFEKAIKADPRWAPPYAGLANSYGWLWISGSLPPQEALPRFNAALRTALEIDGTLPEVRYTLAVSAFYYRWDWTEAEREFERALSLNPNLVEARFEYAWYLASMGRFAQAITEAGRAVERDPLSVSANLALGSVYAASRRNGQAATQFRRTIELEPNDPRAYEFLAGAYMRTGNYDEGVRTYQKAMTLSGARPEKVAALGRAYHLEGYRGFLKKRLEGMSNPYSAAIVYAELGEKDHALENLEMAYRRHSWAMVQLKVITAWDPLRSDPRFQDILRRMNFPP